MAKNHSVAIISVSVSSIDSDQKESCHCCLLGSIDFIVGVPGLCSVRFVFAALKVAENLSWKSFVAPIIAMIAWQDLHPAVVPLSSNSVD